MTLFLCLGYFCEFMVVLFWFVVGHCVIMWFAMVCLFGWFDWFVGYYLEWVAVASRRDKGYLAGY